MVLTFIISATAEAINFKYGVQLGFAMAHDKNTPKKLCVARATGALKTFGVPLIISVLGEAIDSKFGMQAVFTGLST